MRHRTGPGELPVVDVKVDPQRWSLEDEGGFAAAAPELARDAGLEYFVEEHLDQPDAPKLILILDEPERTAPRACLAVALAAELIRWDKKVLVVDGDDHRPDLTRWLDRLDAEGWVDVIRYGISVEAASVPLPFAPKKGRVLGVGSYQPTRVSAEEVAEFLRRQGDAYDHIIVSASTGDRGSVWASQPGMGLACWTPGVQHESIVEGMIRQAAQLGEAPRAVMQLVGRPDGEAPVSKEELAAFGAQAKDSSPVFRRLAGLLAVLLALLAVWWFGFVKRGEEPVVAARETVSDAAHAAGDMLDDAQRSAGEMMDEAQHAAGDMMDAAEETAAGAADAVKDGTEQAAQTASAAADQAREEIGGAAHAAAGAVSDSAEQMRNAIRDEPAAATRPAAGDQPAAATAGNPYARPVGADGWCLHLYSLRHEDVARDMVAGLERQGIRGRIVESPDGDGQPWYRVYAGSFPSRDAARAAEADLMERLGVDYVAPKATADLF
ncbi:MAG TPA: SPOR domain-containing protein [Candidatus Krumholzibacteria bacterium]|nr:SPOR domain-containing protein [Candidatus Krumholzibacteria bacterium]